MEKTKLITYIKHFHTFFSEKGEKKTSHDITTRNHLFYKAGVYLLLLFLLLIKLNTLLISSLEQLLFGFTAAKSRDVYRDILYNGPRLSFPENYVIHSQ